MTSRATQSSDMPGVEYGVPAFGYEKHVEVGLAGSEHARRAVYVDRADEMEIVGKLAAGHERPAAAQPEPALGRHGLSGRSCGARDQTTRVAEQAWARPA